MTVTGRPLQRIRDLMDGLPHDQQAAARRTLDVLANEGLPFDSLPLLPDGEGQLLGSRLGGTPMLSSPEGWPRWQRDDGKQGQALEFVCQLRLDAIPELEGLPLPRTGLLSFFVGWHALPYKSIHDPNCGIVHRETAVVHTADVASLRPASSPPPNLVGRERYASFLEPYRHVPSVGLLSLIHI
ncbi:MAG: DUF1963 domain-containing protein [Nannocystaceae bacterium]|nr:DUF1963 domain-containing protein [Nannocystaceae bacterium]